MSIDASELKKAQKVMLEIMKIIHSICVKHGLIYWLESGTLLGAIRHRGFIPWDDDCDIAMPRKDYEKFLQIARSELPDGYLLQNKYTDPFYKGKQTKIRKINSILIESGEQGDEPYCHGVFVDIFPYDYYPNAFVVQWMRWTCLAREGKNKYKKGSVERMIYLLYINTIALIPLKVSKLFKKWISKKRGIFSNDNYEWFTMSLENDIPRMTRKQDILPPKLHVSVFEGADFYLPSKPENVLKSIYGSSYMEMPPLNKRKTHAKYIKVE